MSNPMTLVLFTSSYPFGKGEQFLETEIQFLAARFERIVVVPTTVIGPRRPVPEDVQVDLSLHEALPRGLARILESISLCAVSPTFYREVWARPELLLNWRALGTNILYLGDAKRVERLFGDFLANWSIAVDDALFYTYWLGRETMALGFAKEKGLPIRLVSRVHGSDLYEHVHQGRYLSYRKATLKGLDHLFTISEHGRRYIIERYACPPLCEVSRLGVSDPGFDARPSGDGVFRVVSCSHIKPIKRLDRLVEGLRVLALRRPELAIQWHHLGDGDLRAGLTAHARSLPCNVESRFHGHLPNSDVIAFYRGRPIDAFINVSESEGVPVSIMEAQSCGIPVIATAVGGTPEIVNPDNGILLSPRATPTEIGSALEALALESNCLERRRQAKLTWEMRYCAEDNYLQFIDRLLTD